MSDVPAFSVPEPYRPAIETIAQASDEEFDSLLSAISELPVGTERQALAGAVSAALKTPAGVFSSQIVASVASLVPLAKSFDISDEEIAGAVSSSQSLMLEDNERPKLRSRLQALIAVPVIVTLGSAQDLLSELKTTFLDVRVLTDIRPIFGRNPSTPPSSAIISQTLKIQFIEESEIHSIHLAVDAGDLKKLSEAIERATAKVATLRSVLEGAGLPVIELAESPS